MTNGKNTTNIRDREYGWIVAVILCVISAALTNLGTNLQKYAWRYVGGDELGIKLPINGNGRAHDDIENSIKDAKLQGQDKSLKITRKESHLSGYSTVSGIALQPGTSRFLGREKNKPTGNKSYAKSRLIEGEFESDGTLDGRLNFNSAISRSVRQRQPLLAPKADHEHVNLDDTLPSAGSASGLADSSLQKESAYVEPSTAKFRFFWWVGFASSALGGFFDFVALGFGTQSIVAPLGSLTLVFNFMFANVFHDEVFSSHDVLSTMVILCGCILCVMFSARETKFSSMDDVFDHFATIESKFYFLGVAAAIGGIIYALEYDYIRERCLLSENNMLNLRRIGYPSVSGIIGAQSVLFAKTLDELLMSTIADSDVYGAFYTHFQTLIILIALIICLLGQIYYINKGLKEHDALIVVPVFQSNWIITSVIGGGMVYGEFNHFSFIQFLAFVTGVALTITGVWLLSSREGGTNFNSDTADLEPLPSSSNNQCFNQSPTKYGTNFQAN